MTHSGAKLPERLLVVKLEMQVNGMVFEKDVANLEVAMFALPYRHLERFAWYQLKTGYVSLQ
jgi:hypothetical protein